MSKSLQGNTHQQATARFTDSDGTFQGQQYFTCDPDHGAGIFVTLEQISPVAESNKGNTMQSQMPCPPQLPPRRSSSLILNVSSMHLSDNEKVLVETNDQQKEMPAYESDQYHVAQPSALHLTTQDAGAMLYQPDPPRESLWAKEVEAKWYSDTLRIKDDEIRSKDQQISALREEVQIKNQQISALREEVQIRNQQITSLQESNNQLQEEVRTKTQLITELAAQEQIQTPLPLTESWSVPRSELKWIPKREVGRGAWGEVFSAKFRGKDVAIKIVHKEVFREFTIDLIKREIMIMSRVQHPNLVRFIAAVWDDAVERQQDTPIIVSELMEMNLRAAYERIMDLTNSLVSIFRDVAYALHYLHQHREPIIHRDISAPNVLLKSLPGGSYRAKVSDFGSANLVRQAQTAGAGAIVYCAPEMFPNEDISVPPQPQTTKVDVFSYGILLLEVISKEMPTLEKRYALLQNIQKKWDVMYALIVHCTNPSPSDRPAMADILTKLNSMPH